MDSAASDQSIIALDGWLQTPAGVYVRAWEQACLDNLTADIFGYNALQIGMSQLDALAANRMPSKWLADTRVRPPAAEGATARRSPSRSIMPSCRSPRKAWIWWCCRMCWNSPPSRTRC